MRSLVGGLAYLQGRESERRYQSPHEHTEDAKTAAREACFNTQTIDPVDCVFEKIQSSYEYAHSEQDLSAQQRAATSALIASVAAVITLVISGFGLWGLLRTIRQGQEAIAGANRANAIAEAAYVNADRPWIFVETVSVNPMEWRTGHEAFEWKFLFRNFGKGPAIIEAVEYGLALSDKLPIVDETPINRRDKTRFSDWCTPLHISREAKRMIVTPGTETQIFMGREGAIPYVGRVDLPDWLMEKRKGIYEATAHGWMSIWLIGKAVYRDAFGNPHETGFCLKYCFRHHREIEEGGNRYNYRT